MLLTKIFHFKRAEKIYVQYMLSALKELYEIEKNRLPLFLPVIFGAGIGAYYSLYNEPDYSKTAWAFAICLFTVFLSCKFKRFIYPLAVVTFLFAAGFFAANTEVVIKKSPVIKQDLGVIWLRAKVEKLEKKKKFYQFTLSEIDLWQPEQKNFPPQETPKKIRLNVRTKISESVNVGDYISTKVILNPPNPLPVYPGDYDFAKYSYLKQIGAVGYSISEVQEFKGGPEPLSHKIRRKIGEKIENNIEFKDAAEIAKALIIGKKGGISEETKEKVRNAGLGHLLAISGMHMSIVMIWCFAFIRLILCIIPKISLYYNVKKISAIFALISGAGYLVISGAPISAIRSYIMLSIFFTAILIDRNAVSMRPVAVAAIIILILEPSSLLTPSFQMSFAAVVGLIGVFEIYREYKYKKNDLKQHAEKSHLKKIMIYFGGILLTTIIASIATSPFSIYHFNTFPKYGALANLIAIPLVTLIALPSIFLSLFFMPFGLEKPLLLLSEASIKLMVDAANYLASDASSVINIAQLPGWFLPLISINLLWFFIFKSKIKLAALPFIVILYLTMFFYDFSPKIVVAGNSKVVALKQEDGSFNFYGDKRQRYLIKQWEKKLGINGKAYFRSSVLPEIKLIGINQKILENNGTHIITESGNLISSKDIQGNRLWGKE